MEKIFSRSETIKLLNMSPAGVDDYARRGLFIKIFNPLNSRLIGYAEQSVLLIKETLNRTCRHCSEKIRPMNKTGLCGKHYHDSWCKTDMKPSTREKNRKASLISCALRAKERYKEEMEYRLLCNLRSRLYAASSGVQRLESTKELIGCSSSELKKYLEKQFASGMSWDNRSTWHIDHIIPCSSFDLTDLKQREKCFHYTNLQPLWAIDNMRKGSKIL